MIMITLCYDGGASYVMSQLCYVMMVIIKMNILMIIMLISFGFAGSWILMIIMILIIYISRSSATYLSLRIFIMVMCVGLGRWCIPRGLIPLRAKLHQNSPTLILNNITITMGGFCHGGNLLAGHHHQHHQHHQTKTKTKTLSSLCGQSCTKIHQHSS